MAIPRNREEFILLNDFACPETRLHIADWFNRMIAIGSIQRYAVYNTFPKLFGFHFRSFANADFMLYWFGYRYIKHFIRAARKGWYGIFR